MRGPAGPLLALAAVLPLAGCIGPAAEPAYAPPDYSYLTPLRLNVGAVEVVRDWVPPADDVGGFSPVPPLAALERMARERLIAAGGQGRAVFRIEDATIRREGERLDGDLAVRLDIIGPNGAPAGHAEAQVTRVAPLADDDELRPTLYRMTSQMMADMNVELEYQVRRTLGRWLMTAAPPGSVVPAPVQRQPLPPPEAPAAGF